MRFDVLSDSVAANEVPPRNRCRRALMLGVALLLSNACALAESPWPTIALPKEVQAFDIGERITVNGMPMHMQGFLSKAPPEQIAAWFRRILGSPLVESRLSKSLILGRPQGEHYLTIQLDPSGMGTRGMIAVAQLRAAFDHHADTRAANERWLGRLPSGSRLIRQIASEDAGKVANHIVIINGHSVELNRDRLQSLMHEDGMVLEREAGADDPVASRLPGRTVDGTTLFFKGPAKEAVAVVFRNSPGQTAIVLNMVTQMEYLK